MHPKKPLRGDPLNKLPPHSIEAEQGVLGCCLLAPLDCLNACEERGMKGEWFYDLRHQMIYHAAQTLHKLGQAMDLITLHQCLKDTGNLESAGGIAYLARLPDLVSSALNFPQYADILQEKWTLRRLLHTCIACKQAIEASEDKPRELLEKATHDLLLLGECATSQTEQTLAQVAAEVLPELEDYQRGSAQITGLTSGLAYADKVQGGFGGEAGNYLVIGARPGTGKTAFLLQVLLRLSADQDLPTYIFSLEMRARALTKRLIFQRAQADMQRWRTGCAQTEDIPKVIATVGEFASVKNLYLDDNKRLSIDALCARARRAHRQYGINCFGLDYIQLLQSGKYRHRPDRQQEMAEISNELLALSNELNVPFIVLAQLNRDWEKEQQRKPRLSDLKDCGDIEQDADIVGLLYRPKLNQEKRNTFDDAVAKAYGSDWSKKPMRVNLLWEKNRNGMTGDCELLFERHCTRFLDYGEWLKQHTSCESMPEQQEQVPEMPSNEEMNFGGGDGDQQ